MTQSSDSIDSCPEVPLELLKHICTAFPDRAGAPMDHPDDLRRRVGVAEVTRYLTKAYQIQNWPRDTQGNPVNPHEDESLGFISDLDEL